MLKVFAIVNEKGLSFDLNSYEFPLTIEVLDLDGERGLFYEYNQLGRPANPTRSRWVNQASLHNQLASQVVEDSQLKNHVEVVRNTISINSPMVVTFNTLAKGIETAFPDLDEGNLGDIKNYLIEYVDCLVGLRREVGYLPLSERKAVREASIGDSGLAFNGYLRLSGDLQGIADWRARLKKLGDTYHYSENGMVWDGDLMSRDNPLWKGSVLLTGQSGKAQISNRNETRAYFYEKMKEVAGIK